MTPLQLQGIGMTSQRTRDRLVTRLKQQGIKNNDVLETMANTPRHVFIEEALHRLVEVYYKIGLVEEAKQAAAILGYNYQSGKWYERSYKVFNKKYKTKKIKKTKEMGLIRRKIKGLFE